MLTCGSDGKGGVGEGGKSGAQTLDARLPPFDSHDHSLLRRLDALAACAICRCRLPNANPKCSWHGVMKAERMSICRAATAAVTAVTSKRGGDGVEWKYEVVRDAAAAG